MSASRIAEYAGLHRSVEIGLRLAPSVASAAAVAKAAASYIDRDPMVPVRLAGVSSEGSRVHITLAFGIGTVDDVKVAAPNARAAILLLETFVTELSAYDPALVTLPATSSAEARCAATLARSGMLADHHADVDASAVGDLVAVV